LTSDTVSNEFAYRNLKAQNTGQVMVDALAKMKSLRTITPNYVHKLRE